MRQRYEIEEQLTIKREALKNNGDNIPPSHYKRLETEVQTLEWVLDITRWE